ncbi:MAG: hypothetical protein JWM49_635 [Microbacteriaceae bacterium]|nr:hypothetical protein [Microbacteriaceae bacterium]
MLVRYLNKRKLRKFKEDAVLTLRLQDGFTILLSPRTESNDLARELLDVIGLVFDVRRASVENIKAGAMLLSGQNGLEYLEQAALVLRDLGWRCSVTEFAGSKHLIGNSTTDNDNNNK